MPFLRLIHGSSAALYDSAYDITLRFCRLAERAYRTEVGDQNASFIRPSWEPERRGLLAGQSLMYDLERMDFAFMERTEQETEGALRVALGDADPAALSTLKETGGTLFSIVEGRFDKEMPDEYARRIKSVHVTLRGIGGRAPAQGPAKTKITVKGSHFTGTTGVTLDEVTCGFSVDSDGVLEVIVPPGVEDGSYPIVVTNSKGVVASSDKFEVTTAGRERPRRYRLGMNALRGKGNARRGGLPTTRSGDGE